MMIKTQGQKPKPINVEAQRVAKILEETHSKSPNLFTINRDASVSNHECVIIISIIDS